MGDQERRIMVTGAGGPGAVNLSRSLMAIEPTPFILAVDASPAYVHLALGHARAVVPRCDQRDAYIDALNALIAQHKITFVMPNNSLEIGILSAERHRLNAPIFLPKPATLAVADSKWASYQVWRGAGVPVPETHLIETPDDLERAFAAMQPDPETPVWVRGAGIPGKGIGVASLPCRTVAQAVQWVDYWRGWGGMIASEFLPGDNLTWMGLYREGRLLASQCRRRDAYIIPHVSPSGITGAPAISHTLVDPVMAALGERAAHTLDPGMDGVVFVDMKGDRDNAPKITELNAGRFGTTHYFYTAAGANFPEYLLQAAEGAAFEAPILNPLPADLYWIRTLDAGPVLLTGEALRAQALWTDDGTTPWPNIPQRFNAIATEPIAPWNGDPKA